MNGSVAWGGVSAASGAAARCEEQAPRAATSRKPGVVRMIEFLCPLPVVRKSSRFERGARADYRCGSEATARGAGGERYAMGAEGRLCAPKERAAFALGGAGRI